MEHGASLDFHYNIGAFLGGVVSVGLHG